jgi:catechol 2,3-dioxygenase-like lactoylglutathione lyase family enzyme
MNLKYTYTRLNVENYKTCKHFYEEILGLKVIYANDINEYAELDTGETIITLLNRARLSEFVGSTETVTYDRQEAKVALTFRVDNLDDAIAQLKAKNIELVNSPWQRMEDGLMQGGSITACFRDPDGNLIELEQLLS